VTARNGWLAAFEKLAIKPTGTKVVHPLGELDTRTLPSLRGPRSPKGVNGGMTADEDKARRLKRQQARRRATAKAPMPTEHQEQAAVIQWWTVYAAAHKLDVRLLLAIPNAQKFMSLARNMHAALATIRAEGFRDAAPDLLLAIPRRMVHQSADGSHRHIETTYCGLFCEMKRLDGKLSADQHSFGTLLQSQGYAWTVAKGAGEAIRAIEAYLGDAPAAKDAEIPNSAEVTGKQG